MARRSDEGVPYEEPKPDIHLALMVITLGALLVATIIMYVEYASLS